MHRKLIYLSLLLLQFSCLSAKQDSICGGPLHYQVLSTTGPTEGFFWRAGDKLYNVYYKGADFILENKRQHQLWLITGASFNPHLNREMYIDSVFFKNTSESPEKELVIIYSLYSMNPDNSGKSKYMLIVDLRDKVMLLNIATHDHRLEKDENGKFVEYLYDCDIDLFHDGIRVTTSDDSDINDARTQLDDGIYIRRGHCYVYHK